jgi:hypothetical protein
MSRLRSGAKRLALAAEADVGPLPFKTPLDVLE